MLKRVFGSREAEKKQSSKASTPQGSQRSLSTGGSTRTPQEEMWLSDVAGVPAALQDGAGTPAALTKPMGGSDLFASMDVLAAANAHGQERVSIYGENMGSGGADISSAFSFISGASVAEAGAPGGGAAAGMNESDTSVSGSGSSFSFISSSNPAGTPGATAPPPPGTSDHFNASSSPAATCSSPHQPPLSSYTHGTPSPASTPTCSDPSPTGASKFKQTIVHKPVQATEAPPGVSLSMSCRSVLFELYVHGSSLVANSIQIGAFPGNLLFPQQPR